MPANNRRQPGFALLLTLVLVLIAAIALAALARQSTSEALNAVEETEALQRRWAVESSRATLLPRTKGVLDKINEPPQDDEGKPIITFAKLEPTIHHWVRCKLAGIDYDLVLTDEQAKYNPTVMQMLVDRSRNERALTMLAKRGPERRGERVRAVLRPMVGINIDGSASEEEIAGPNGERELPEVYAHFGQVFDNVSPTALLGSEDRPGPASRVTLWGDGRVHIKYAQEPVVRQVVGQLLGPEGSLEFFAARRDSPQLTAAEWMSAVTKTEPQQLLIAKSLLVDQSETHGLWVVVRGKTRDWHTFSVQVYQPEEENDDQIIQNQPTDRPVIQEPGRKADNSRDEDNNTADADGDKEDTADQDELSDELISPYKRYDFAW